MNAEWKGYREVSFYFHSCSREYYSEVKNLNQITPSDSEEIVKAMGT